MKYPGISYLINQAAHPTDMFKSIWVCRITKDGVPTVSTHDNYSEAIKAVRLAYMRKQLTLIKGGRDGNT